jgi:hypothetical protein
MAKPLKGDRSAHDSVNYPGYHAKDLEDGTPIQHLPTGPSSGDVPVWDGSKWVNTPQDGTPDLPLENPGDMLYMGTTEIVDAETDPNCSSNNSPDHTYIKIHDGDPNTYWESYNETVMQAWVDAGTAVPPGSYRVGFCIKQSSDPTHAASVLHVQAANSGSYGAFFDVGYFVVTSAEQTFMFDDPVLAINFRFTAGSGGSSTWRIYDLQLYRETTPELQALPIGDENEHLVVEYGLPVWKAFTSGSQSGSSGGDMYRSTYDPDLDGKVENADFATTSGSVPWTGVTGKPSTYPPDTHDHDSRYYTETEQQTSGQAQLHWDNLTNKRSFKLDDMDAPDDNIDLNSGSGKHGLLPKLSGNSSQFLNGQGSWSVPTGGSGGSGSAGGDMYKSAYDPDLDNKVENADNADFATNSGSSGYATNSGSSGYATTSGSTPTAGSAGSVPWTGVSGKPIEFSPSAHAPTHTSSGSDPIKLDDLAAPDNNTDLDATITTHGLLKRLDGSTAHFLRGDGSWATPPASGSGGSGSGGGDMYKADYDPDTDNIVEHADLADAAPWSGITSKPTSFWPSAHYLTHTSSGSDSIKLDDLAIPDDNTDLNSGSGRHGLLVKLAMDTGKFLRSDGAWVAPPTSGSSSTGITGSGVADRIPVFNGVTSVTSYNWLTVNVGDKRLGVSSQALAPTATLSTQNNYYSEGGPGANGQLFNMTSGVTGDNRAASSMYFTGEGSSFDQEFGASGCWYPYHWMFRNRNTTGTFMWYIENTNIMMMNYFGQIAFNKEISNTSGSSQPYFTIHHRDGDNPVETFRVETNWATSLFALKINGQSRLGPGAETSGSDVGFYYKSGDFDKAIRIDNRWETEMFVFHQNGSFRGRSLIATEWSADTDNTEGLHMRYDTGQHKGRLLSGNPDTGAFYTPLLIHSSDIEIYDVASSHGGGFVGSFYAEIASWFHVGIGSNLEIHTSGSAGYMHLHAGGAFSVESSLFQVFDANGHVCIGDFSNGSYAVLIPNSEWYGAVDYAHSNIINIVTVDANDDIKFGQNHVRFNDFLVNWESPADGDVMTWSNANTKWEHAVPPGGGTGTNGRAVRWGTTNNPTDSGLAIPASGGNVLTLSPSTTCTLTIANTASIVGTFSAAGRTLTVQTGDVKLTGAGSTTELSLPNAKITFAGGGTSCSITLPNFAMTFAGAAGKTLTLTNSLTNQGGNDGVLSWSGAFTLTIPATGTTALLGTANVFTALQTASISDAATNTVVNPLNVTHNSSSGSVTAAFGVREYHNLKSTTTADTNAASIETQWVVATHASRTARTTLNSIDYGGVREVIRIQGSGTAGMLGFFGVTAVVRATAYTQTYNTASKTAAALTYVSPGAYIGGANGYSTTAQAQAIITALGQLSADDIAIYKVVTQILDDLQAYGLLQ